MLACDLRFASRENTLLGQFEVGIGVVPGGGPMARLARLVGRGRALEILLVADDLDGPRAERYGYVNRLIADDRLDDEVEAIASRLERFDHDAIARTKSYVDQVTLPADSELRRLWPTSASCSGAPRSRRNGPGSRRSGSTPTATSNARSGGASSSPRPTPERIGPGPRRGRGAGSGDVTAPGGTDQGIHGRDRFPASATVSSSRRPSGEDPEQETRHVHHPPQRRRPPRRPSSSSPGSPTSGPAAGDLRQQRRRLPRGARPGPRSRRRHRGLGGIWERLHYDWSDPSRVVLTTTDSNVWGGDSGHTYTFTPQPDGTTEVDVVVVRDGKNLKGRALGVVLGIFGKRVLGKALENTVKAIEARDGAEQAPHLTPAESA